MDYEGSDENQTGVLDTNDTLVEPGTDEAGNSDAKALAAPAALALGLATAACGGGGGNTGGNGNPGTGGGPPPPTFLTPDTDQKAARFALAV